MKQTINFYQFEQAFKDCGRSDQFTYEGLKALFEWFEEIDTDCGTETELDVIAICCEFTEYANLGEYISDYGDIGHDCYVKAWRELQDNTFVIPVNDNGFIIQDF